MKTNEPIILSRDCEAIQIPSGKNVMLPIKTYFARKRYHARNQKLARKSR